MFIVDDPMLALIARFIVDVDNLDGGHEEFLQRQVQTMQRYVEKYPPAQQQMKAMQWIQNHARNYRRDWQKRIISEQVAEKKCPDCPLVVDDPSSPCEIHDLWVDLLKAYMEDNITSTDYVEDTLKLLDDNKARLKVASIHVSQQKAT